MPVRMVEDDNDDSRGSGNSGGGSSSGGGGGGWGWLAILGFLFVAFRKWPKTTLVVLLILGILYFLFSSGGNEDHGSSNNNTQSSEGTGCQMKQEVFDQAEVFEPLSAEGNSLPAAVSLEKYAPERLSQGQQGSCVGWASAYAARTILEATATGKNPNELKFSPSFLYNQIGSSDCNGSYVVDAMKKLMSVGAMPFEEFPYDEEHCDRLPNEQQINEAQHYTMRGYNRLTKDDDNYSLDLLAMKQNIAQGAPVVIGMQVGGTFEQMNGNKSWIPTEEDYNNKDQFGGHALCVIGYDDNLNGGSFQIMNSWGEDFGVDGLFWMPYEHFTKFTNEAYGLYPLESKKPEDKKKLKASFGLVNNTSKEYVQLSKKSGNTFETPVLPIGTKFKIAVKNDAECYTYVFGQETDGSSYVLFPYTAKHSSFCGITGARLFPKDYSMQLDDKGTKDFMAIVVSKKPLDFKNVNDLANQNTGGSYESMLKAALSDVLIKNVGFKDGETIGINETDAEDSAVLMVIEINKK
jgi:C1A family cysteine protease